MTTFTINDPIIEQKYTNEDIKRKFLFFIQTELKEDNIDLYQISVDDLSEKSKKRLDNIDNLNFINY